MIALAASNNIVGYQKINARDMATRGAACGVFGYSIQLHGKKLMNLNKICNLLLQRRNDQFMNEKWLFTLVKKRLTREALLQSIIICHIGLEIWSKAIICIHTHVLVNL